jgi:hypothetical protein
MDRCALRLASNQQGDLDVPFTARPGDIAKLSICITPYARPPGTKRFTDVNATTLTPSLAAVGGPGTNSAAGFWPISLNRFAHAVRFLGWGAVGLIAAFASYIFGLAALVLGLLGHLRLEGDWWPAVLCLFLGYLSARASIACMDIALTPSSAQNQGSCNDSMAARA